MFAIICNARKGSTQGIHTLALVDRTKCRTLWWTSDNRRIIEAFATKPVAEARAKALSKNTPRVVSLDYAKDLMKRQGEAVDEHAAEKDRLAGLDAVEWGWDGHKNAW